MVMLNVTIEYEALKIQTDNESSSINCTTTPGNFPVVLYIRLLLMNVLYNIKGQYGIYIHT